MTYNIELMRKESKEALMESIDELDYMKYEWKLCESEENLIRRKLRESYH